MSRSWLRERQEKKKVIRPGLVGQIFSDEESESKETLSGVDDLLLSDIDRIVFREMNSHTVESMLSSGMMRGEEFIISEGNMFESGSCETKHMCSISEEDQASNNVIVAAVPDTSFVIFGVNNKLSCVNLETFASFSASKTTFFLNRENFVSLAVGYVPFGIDFFSTTEVNSSVLSYACHTVFGKYPQSLSAGPKVKRKNGDFTDQSQIGGDSGPRFGSHGHGKNFHAAKKFDRGLRDFLQRKVFLAEPVAFEEGCFEPGVERGSEDKRHHLPENRTGAEKLDARRLDPDPSIFVGLR